MTIIGKDAVRASTQRVCAGPLASYVDRFTAFLSGEGYAAQTVRTKCALIVRLSHWLKRHGVTRLARLDEEWIRKFHAHRRNVRGRGDVSTSRQLLEFLRSLGAVSPRRPYTDRSALGQLTRDYARFLISERGLALSTVVGYVAMLRSCDRHTASGQRDYAMLLLLARLGLRGGEVLALTLDDLDWERGEMLVRGKGQRYERLPLPKDVGAALVHYLRYVRPTCATRAVFVRLHAPQHALSLSAV